MTVYLAGKITGDQDYAAKFAVEADKLTCCGHTVLSPAVLPEGMLPGDYMRICFAMIDVADAVAFLPDWIASKGARLEREYCRYTGKSIVN